VSGRLLPFFVGFSSFAAPLNELFVFAFPRFRALLSHRRAGGFLFSNCGPKRGITSKQEQGQAQRHGGRAMRYVCCWILRVFVADFGRSEVDFLALFTRRAGPLFFQNPPQFRREKTDFGKSNGKDKSKGMENGRYGTFIVEESWFLLRIFVDRS
jgi:hypothetical protein